MDRRSFRTNAPRLALLAVLAMGIVVFFAIGGYRAFTFVQLVRHKDTLIAAADAHAVLAPILFVAAYLVLGLFGLPGSTVLNVTSGLLFDFGKGLLVVMLASTLASLVAFLSFRYLFRSIVLAKVQDRFPELEEGLRREGFYVVFALRLIPVIPYSLTNLLLAVSPVSFWTYLWVSSLAMLPRCIIYVYAGSHLGDVQDPDDFFSPALISALALLAVLPWALKQIGRKFKK